MYGGAADERGHDVLRSQKLKLHIVLPAPTALEEIAEPFNALGFAGAWYSEEAISERLAGPRFLGFA